MLDIAEWGELLTRVADNTHAAHVVSIFAFVMSATAESRERPPARSGFETRARTLFARGKEQSRKATHALVHLPPTRLLIALSIILLMSSWGAATFFAFRSHSTVIESSQVVVQALGVQERLQGILAMLDRADGAGRAFLLTRRREYLAPFHEMARKIPPEVSALVAVTEGDPLYAEDLKQLRSLIGERLDLMGSQLSKEGVPAGDYSAFVVAINERGIALMDAIHVLAWRMINAEQLRLATRQAEFSVRARFGSAWLLLFFGVNAVFAGATLLLAMRMSRLQRFAKVCAWSRTIEYEGEWLSFEQYLERKFKIQTSHGISPGEAAKLMSQSPETFGSTAGRRQDDGTDRQDR
ncbi:MAG: CHASE3 domain-containing protein [Opitutaceae bacterium]